MSSEETPIKEQITLSISPSVADPAWVFAWADEKNIFHSDYESLMAKILQLMRKRAFEEGRQAGETEACEVLGVSGEDYVRAWLKKKEMKQG